MHSTLEFDRASTRAYLYGSLVRKTASWPALPWPIFRIHYVWRAAWLGLLDSAALTQVTVAHYMGASGFDSGEFNIDQGLWPWEADAVQSHFPSRARVLVAGAGGGREAIALARLGHKVTAFDGSPRLTTACRQNLESAGCVARVLDAPPNRLPHGVGTHEALLIGRGFYHHIPTRAGRVAFLEDCRRHIKTGAPVILSDFFTRPVSSRFYSSTHRIANFIRWSRAHPEQVELGDSLGPTFQHFFTREEIEQELVDSGIACEDYRATQFAERSHLAHILGRAT